MDSFLSDFDSYSDSSSFEDQDDSENMYGGQASCILSSLAETIGKIDDFLSFERGFARGDIVCSVVDPSGQMGKVTNVEMIVDLENVYGTKMNHVQSKKLGKIRSISVGDYVVGGPWLGKVESIVDYVTILFDDGTKCEYTTMGPEKLVPLSPDLIDDSQYPYYPGQRVRVELSSIAKTSRWLCGPGKGKQYEGTVSAVDAGMVYVDWLACALLGCNKLAAPPRLQSSTKLTLLSYSSHENWQLGDWCTLPLIDDMSVREHFSPNSSNFGLTQSERAFDRSNAPKIQDLFVIVKTMTKLDVLWQDGNQSFGLDPNALFPINIVDAHDFWPDQYVMEKGGSDDPHIAGNQRWGVVRSMDAKERTVRVWWETSSANQATGFEEELMEETVSAYELVEHPDYAYCIDDVVFGVPNGQLLGVAGGKLYKDDENGRGLIDEAADLKGDVCRAEDKNELLSRNYLSQIGIIVGFNNGNVEVKWGTGLKTKVAPHDIVPVDKYDSLSVTSVLHDENAERPTETEHDSNSIGHERKDLLSSNVDGNDSQKKAMDYTALSLPRSAIGFCTKVATNLFNSLGLTSPPSTFDHVPEFQLTSGMPSEMEVIELCNLCTLEQPLDAVDLQIHSEQKVEKIQNNKIFLSPSGSKPPKDFGQFDMVSDCSDHHFVNGSGKSLTSSQMKRGWLKKIQQEWNILEKDLPESIYVRSYEERMDLLRAAIVGAPGTPYHDNIFFFDILLPPEYPHEPPLVHYNSGGLRVNPNLYESGKVCLSLLNTWTGSGNEVWNPGSSTILQVLLSIQALVLNEKPYFNEAGYDKQVGRAEGEKNSVGYNENAFLVCCKSMLYLLRKPPKHFEELVKEHFSGRCKYILQACNAYMEGIPVGCAFEHTKSDEEIQKGSSTGFKLMLAKLIPKLVEAFSDKGMDCTNYIQPEE